MHLSRYTVFAGAGFALKFMKSLVVKTYLILALVIVCTSNYSLERDYLTLLRPKVCFPTDKFE